MPRTCDNTVLQYVPHGWDYKEVKSKCGTTGIHGELLVCDDCLPHDAVVIPRSKLWDDYGDYEGYKIWFNVELPEEIPLEAAQRAIGNILERRCYCEHDCCGCWNGWGSIEKQIGKRTYLCSGHYAPNY